MNFTRVVKVGDKDINLKSRVKVSKGEYSHPILCTYTVGDYYYLSLGKKGKFLKNKDFIEGYRNFFTTDNYEAMKITKDLFEVLTDAINTYNNVRDYSLTSFSFIYGYCYSRGIDLYKEGVFRK